MVIIGIDPGPDKSALIGWDGNVPFWPKYSENNDIFTDLAYLHASDRSSILAVERPVCQRYSGVSVSDTAIVAGMCIGVWGVFGESQYHMITRSKIRWHVGHKRKTNDSVVRKSLIDRIFPDYNLHNNPGILVGITGDIWQALAAAVTCFDLIEGGELNGYKGS